MPKNYLEMVGMVKSNTVDKDMIFLLNERDKKNMF